MKIIDTFAETKTLTQNVVVLCYLLNQQLVKIIILIKFYVIKEVLQGEAEKVSLSKIDLLNKSLLTSPSSISSLHTKADSVTIHPSTINEH